MRKGFYDRWFSTTGDYGSKQVRYEDIAAFECNEKDMQLKIFLRGSDHLIVYAFSSLKVLSEALEELQNHL